MSNDYNPAWAHLHLPRFRAGDPSPISVKIPGERISYVPSIELFDVRFIVSQPGRRRCLREGVRNVHAWVVGAVVGCPSATVGAGMRKAVYDPWKGDQFVDAETLEQVFTARRVVMIGKDVWYAPASEGVEQS